MNKQIAAYLFITLSLCRFPRCQLGSSEVALVLKQYCTQRCWGTSGMCWCWVTQKPFWILTFPSLEQRSYQPSWWSFISRFSFGTTFPSGPSGSSSPWFSSVSLQRTQSPQASSVAEHAGVLWKGKPYSGSSGPWVAESLPSSVAL